MIYLKDTCILIGKLDSCELISMLHKYNEIDDIFALTDVVIDELEPGKTVEVKKADKSKSMKRAIEMIYKSNPNYLHIYNVKDDKVYINNFKKIRRAFYGHLKDLKYIKEALRTGEITKEQFDNRSYLYKDYGECSCIAVAIENPDDILIVTEDKGRIFLKTNINLFDKYKESNNIKVIEYDEWKHEFDSKCLKKKA
ncbi:hypothetical protein [Terrisporobacter petrolearius]|uniref:hypothetical protein n=1 Tax=Terrisporobacter petrolearius TaxID=1460447 RepID=UPI0022DEAD49|nr:hypothetical protein [Terrisporobacter petrolearius]